MTSRFHLPAVLALALVGAACSSDPSTPQPPAPVAGMSAGGSAGAVGVAGSGGQSGGSGGVSGGSGGASGGSGGVTAGAGGSGGSAAGSGGAGDTMPTLLSQTGLYSDIVNKKISGDVHPFTPAYTLWSDTATKHRYVYMPPGSKINTDDMEYWRYPAGFKLWKDFTRDNKLIETRLLLKKSDGRTDWYMVSFKWKDDYSDAEAIPAGEMNAMGTPHDIPSKDDCLGCHGTMSDHAIGFTAMMLSHNLPDSLNLTQIADMGWLSTAPQAGGYPLPGTDVEKKALGYLHANCGMCHNTNSNVYKAKAAVDFWSHLDQLQTVPQTRAYLSMVCDQWLPENRFDTIKSCAAGHATGAPMETDISKLKRITPRDPTNSGIIDLMSLRATGVAGMMKQMPPLGTEMVDTDGVASVNAWINALPLN